MPVTLHDDFTGKPLKPDEATQVQIAVQIRVDPTGDGASMTFGPFILDREGQKDIRNVKRYQELHAAVTSTLLAGLAIAAKDFQARIAGLKEGS